MEIASPDGQEKDRGCVVQNLTGYLLGAKLPLPYVLIRTRNWAGTISQVGVTYAMYAPCGFNCAVVNFVKFFHDELQI